MGSNEKKVLFVGPVSSGKTTLINSLFNYVKNDKYPTEVEIPIGMNVKLTNSVTRSTMNVPVGTSDDDRKQISYYQVVIPETLIFDGHACTLIDTPGLKGNYDNHVKENIKFALQSHSSISTVCFVIEQSYFLKDAKVFCTDFLSSFSDLTYDNIIFCVTNYKPKDDQKSDDNQDLNKVLESFPLELKNKLNKKHLFCFNNDGFIHAIISSLQVDEIYKNDLRKEEGNAKRSWENSALTAQALLKAIRKEESDVIKSSNPSHSIVLDHQSSLKSGGSLTDSRASHARAAMFLALNHQKMLEEMTSKSITNLTTPETGSTKEKDPHQHKDITNTSAAGSDNVNTRSSDENEKKFKDHLNKQTIRINELLKIVASKDQENEKLKKEVEEREASVQTLTQLRADNEEIIRKEKEEKEKLEGEMKETKELLQSSKAENFQLEQKLSEEKRVVTNLREELERSDRRNKELENKSKQERAQFEEKERHWTHEELVLRQDFEYKLNEEKTLLQKSEDQHKEKQEKLQSDNSNLSTSLRNVETELSKEKTYINKILGEKKQQEEIIRKQEDELQLFKTAAQQQKENFSVFCANFCKNNDSINHLIDSNTYTKPFERETVLPKKTIKSKFSEDEKIILLLGETGVGKSTFINCALNYKSHSDIYEAMRHKARILIPTHVDIYDEQYTRTNTKLFKHNIDSHVVYDEKVSKGQSLTQKARYYKINDGRHKYVLIDTAGIGDTRGVDKDKENLDELKKFLRDEGVTHIHAVCILMHPNFKRMTDSMIYALNSTVDFFGPPAYDNIFFCFTRTASTSFKPGDTLSVLRDYLKERATKAGRYLKTDTSNVFCFENSCFREKLVYEMNDVHKPEQRTVEAWNKSVDSMNKLFDAIYRHEKPFDIPVGWYKSRNN